MLIAMAIIIGMEVSWYKYLREFRKIPRRVLLSQHEIGGLEPEKPQILIIQTFISSGSDQFYLQVIDHGAVDQNLI